LKYLLKKTLRYNYLTDEIETEDGKKKKIIDNKFGG
jgi:hypothetical protein